MRNLPSVSTIALCSLILATAGTGAFRGAAASADGSTAPSASAPATPVTIGHKIYIRECEDCHGEGAKGLDGPDLRELPESDAEIAETIREGVVREMPAFKKHLKSEQISSVIAYLRSLKKESTPSK